MKSSGWPTVQIVESRVIAIQPGERIHSGVVEMPGVQTQPRHVTLAWREYGVRAVIHPHAGGCIEFADEIERLANDSSANSMQPPAWG
jgi:hypothetical protein